MACKTLKCPFSNSTGSNQDVYFNPDWSSRVVYLDPIWFDWTQSSSTENFSVFAIFKSKNLKNKLEIDYNLFLCLLNLLNMKNQQYYILPKH